MNKTSSIARLFVIGGGIVLIIAGMRAVAHIVNMVLLAYVVILLSTPIMRWLTSRRVPVFVAVVLVLLLIIGVILFVGWIMFVSAGQLVKDFPQYLDQLAGSLESLQTSLAEIGIDVSQITLPDSLSLSSVGQSVLSAAEKALAGISGVVVSLGFVIVIVFFALFEVKHLPARFSRAFQGDDHILNKLLVVNHDVRKYLVLKAVTGAVMAAGNTAFLLVMGVRFAFLWGAAHVLNELHP